MFQPKKWWVGLIPLALVFVFAMFRTPTPVETDLAGKAAEEFKRSGLTWAKATLAGRDAMVEGVAPDPESQKLAGTTALRAFGVRQVSDRTTVLPEARPYGASTVRAGTKITLTGSVPSDEARAAAVAAAKAAIPNADVVDQRTLARGAPSGYAAGLGHGLAQLGRLTAGTASLSDSALSVSGTAGDFAGFDAVTAALKALPASISLGKAEIAPPVVSPFEFNAVRSAAGIALSGVIPSEAARAGIVAAARAAAAGGQVSDALRVAGGAAAGVDYAQAAAFALGQIARLNPASAKISGNALTVSGAAADVPTYEAVRGALGAANLPGGLTLAAQAVTGPTASPFTWSAQRVGNGLALGGFVPSEAVRGGILDAARTLFPGASIVDQMKLALGAPNGFANAATAALAQLAKLASGSAAISNTALSITGEVARSAADQVRSAISSALPPGFTGQANLTVLLPPPPPPPPAPPPAPAAPAVSNIIVPMLPPLVLSPIAQECQDRFKDMLSKEKIRFATGRADIQEESNALIKALADQAQKCAAARIEVQGHTDSDGAPEANKALSERRAAAVAQRLQDFGILRSRLVAVGMGQTRPIADNATPEGKAENRRIEFLVSE